jgi:hypothetical protein
MAHPFVVLFRSNTLSIHLTCSFHSSWCFGRGFLPIFCPLLPPTATLLCC